MSRPAHIPDTPMNVQEYRDDMPKAAPADENPLTRREAAEFLTTRGYRISASTLAKMCSPAINTGPASCGRWGRDSMYMPSALLVWARQRMSPGGAIARENGRAP
jgi:hypothetical protein